MPSDQRLKMAFVGCGGIAQAHPGGIQRVAIRINVTAAVDTNAEAAAAMAAATGGQSFADLDTALMLSPKRRTVQILKQLGLDQASDPQNRSPPADLTDQQATLFANSSTSTTHR